MIDPRDLPASPPAAAHPSLDDIVTWGLWEVYCEVLLEFYRDPTFLRARLAVDSYRAWVRRMAPGIEGEVVAILSGQIARRLREAA